MAVRRGYVRSSHGQVHYRTAGDSGPNVLLLHQTPLSSDTFTEIVEILGQKNRAVAFDTPGFGESDAPPEQWTIPRYADAIIEGINGLGWDSLVIVGRLTGSTFATEVAARLGNRVQGLVLSDLPDYEDDVRREKLNSLNPIQYKEDGSQAMDIWRRQATMNAALPALTIHRAVVATLKGGHRGEEAHHAVFSYDPKPSLATISCPVLLLHSEKDRFLDRDPIVQSILKDSRTEIIPGTGMIVMENPPAFAAAVQRFISSLSA